MEKSERILVGFDIITAMSQKCFVLKRNLDGEESDAFVSASDSSNLLQSSHWAAVKSDWKSEFIGIYEGENLRLAASLLIRPLPLGFSMIYIPRGPLVKFDQEDLLTFFVSALREIAKEKRAIFVKIDPALSLDELTKAGLSTLENVGFKWQGLSAQMSETIQPRFNAVIHAADFSREKLDKKTQQFLRKADHSFLEVEIGGAELVEAFSQLMKKTEQRQGVHLRDGAYYKKLLENYPTSSFIYLTRINLTKNLAAQEQLVSDLKEKLEKTQNKKRRTQLMQEEEQAQKSLSNLTDLIEKHGERPLSAGTLTVDFAGCAETLYAGTDTDFQRYYPSYYAWLGTIEHAFNMGAKTLNMGGLENSLSETDGLLNFKKHFSPRIEEYVGEFDLPTKPFLYRLSQIFYRLLKRLRSSH